MNSARVDYLQRCRVLCEPALNNRTQDVMKRPLKFWFRRLRLFSHFLALPLGKEQKFREGDHHRRNLKVIAQGENATIFVEKGPGAYYDNSLFATLLQPPIYSLFFLVVFGI